MTTERKPSDSARSVSINDKKACVTDSPDIEECKWYHGYMPREEINRLLRVEGDFILRQTELKKGYGFQLVLSIKSGDNKAYHFPIFMTNQKKLYLTRTRVFDSVSNMVKHYQESGEKINDRTGAILKTPILRQSWELHRENIELGAELGHGEYGTVHRGFLKEGQNKTPVAIKLLKVALDKSKIKDFAREARLLRDIKHPNIVNFFGVSFDQEPIVLCMELADGGSLDRFLKKHSTNTATKLQMCVDAARGLSYLHSKNCIHRDISARNCLVSYGRVKISDFGLAYHLAHANEKNEPKNVEKMPVRWLAPEAMQGTYSHKSDVYSYGVLMWEIFSDAQIPFKGMPLLQVYTGVQNEKLRLQKPDSMPDEIGNVMTRGCFDGEPTKRLTMDAIREALENQLTEKYGGEQKIPTSVRSAKPTSIKSSRERIPKDGGGISNAPTSNRAKSSRHV